MVDPRDKRIADLEAKVEALEAAKEAAEAENERLRQVSSVLKEAERRLRLLPMRRCSQYAI